MITEFFANLSFDLAVWFAGLFPDWEIPAWMMDSRNTAYSLMEQYGDGLGVWVDWGALGICLAAVTIAYSIGGLLKLTRAALAHLPQVGGSGD